MDNDGKELMNEYYTEAGPKLAQRIDQEWGASENLRQHNSIFKFDFIPDLLVMDIKICKSSAMNNLSTRYAFLVLTVELTHFEK